MGSPQKILVVEDVPNMRQMVVQALVSAGFPIVKSAEHGKEAVEKLEAENFDVVVSDYEMPEMNGLELLKWARASETYKNVPFIVLTTHAERDIVMGLLQAGVSQYIVKPANANQLLEKVNQAYKKHNP